MTPTQAPQLSVLAQTMRENQEQYAQRLDSLARQIAEEARQRADAETKALTYYRAHTEAQARSQVRCQMDLSMLCQWPASGR